jgi:hypothetical protein
MSHYTLVTSRQHTVVTCKYVPRFQEVLCAIGIGKVTYNLNR